MRSRTKLLRHAALWLLPFALACSTRHRSSTPSEEGSTRPSKGEARVIELDLTAGAPEAISGGLFALPATRTYTGLVRSLEKGLATDTTAGVFVRLDDGGLDLAQAQEVGDLLARFVKKGVPVVCHANGLSNATAAFVQRACTRRYLGAAGEAETVGIAAEVVYMKSLLDRLKIEVDFMHVGKFKSGPEPLLQDGPSPEARESLDFALGSIRDGWLALAAKPDAKAALELGPWSPPEAKAHGLVDELGYASDAVADVHRLAKTTATEAVFGPRSSSKHGIDIGDIVHALVGGDSETSKPHVAVVPMEGAITTSGGGSPFSSGGITSQAMVKVLQRLARTDAVKAVVIRLDSPGGSPLASDLIWHELMNLRKKKPVLASVGGMAASGGFYIASGAQKIYAEPSSIVGSIGVFGGKLVFSPGLKELGISTYTFPANHVDGAAERAGYLSPLVPWNDDTRARMRAVMQAIYDLFVARVAEGRKMPAEKVLTSAEGRIWSAPQGLERGLIDQIGGLEDAIVEARTLGKVPSDSPVTVEGGAEGLLDMLNLGDDDETDASHIQAAIARYEARRTIALDVIPERLRPFVVSLAPLFMGESVIAALPYGLTVH